MTTQNKSLQQPAYNSGSWDVPLNANFGVIDSALGSSSTISATSNYTLSTSEIQSMRLLLNGSLSSSITISVPSGVQGSWIITNYTTWASTSPCYVSFATTSGSTNYFELPRGNTTTVYSDGTVIYPITPYVLPGTIISFAGPTAPGGYILCDGSALPRMNYASLFHAIGTTWGAGDGSTTFNVPNLQGYFLRGAGTSSYDPDSPRAVGTGQADLFKSHTHSDSGHTHPYWYPTVVGAQSGSSTNCYIQATPTNDKTTGISYANIQSTGGVETRPVNAAVLYCIKA